MYSNALISDDYWLVKSILLLLRMLSDVMIKQISNFYHQIYQNNYVYHLYKYK